MSIEGMWGLLTGQYDNPVSMDAGGVVTLETGRVFGGDGAMAYIGTYQVNGKQVTADATSWTWNPAYLKNPNVFGVTGEERISIGVEGTWVADNRIEGFVFMKNNPSVRLPAVMQKFAELP